MSFEAAYASAISSGTFGPGVTLLASNATGTFAYEQSLGVRSLDKLSPASSQPFDSKTFVRLASCTKLLTSIAVLQCVERGLLSLDADISSIIPELAVKSIVSFGTDGSLVEKASSIPITLRQLLTHTAGTSYPFLSPVTQKWQEVNGVSPIGNGATVVERFGSMPLAFEPGTSWEYGVGYDWAGHAVAIVSGTSLEEFMDKNIFQPLGLTGITFWPSKHLDLMEDVAGLCDRDVATGLVELARYDLFLGDESLAEELGGSHAFGRVGDYFEVLKAVLRRDVALLKPDTWETLFAPQLNEQGKAAIRMLAAEEDRDGLRGLNGHIDVLRFGLDQGLGGMLCASDVPGYQTKGRMHWGGMPGLEWFVDSTAGLCGLVATQLYATGDEAMTDLHRKWTLGIYERYNAWKLNGSNR